MKLKAIGDPSVGVILGFLVFTVIFGWKILDPTYFDWLTSYNNDPIMNFLGWHFFRFEDWTFPLGLIKNFGTPDGSSLVYVDSIPLLALPFKLLRGILPPIFQYAGLWLLSCYVLQGFFAWLLAKKITSNLISRIVITLFFTISPIMLYRADRHEALTGHWMILAAIYLYVISVEKLISVEKINKDINSPCLIRWTLLLVATSLVHFYLCAMVLGIYTAYVIAILISKKFRFSPGMFKLCLPVICVLIAMYSIGYFILPPDYLQGSGKYTFYTFGYFSMNLLAPFAPIGDGMSYFFKTLTPVSVGQYEGFNYLGLGVLLLILALAILVMIKFRDFKRYITTQKAIFFIPLILISFIFAVYSLSNKITFGHHYLFEYPLPGITAKLCRIFRSSGRFFWLAYYIIMLFVFIGYKNFFKQHKKLLTVIFCIALCIQIIDLKPFITSYQQKFKTVEKYVYPPLIISPFWEKIDKEYNEIAYYPPDDFTYFLPFSLIAAPNQISLNVVYRGRVNYKVLFDYNNGIRNELATRNLRKNVIYAFKDEKTYLFIKGILNKNDFADEIDGVYIIALDYYNRE